MWRRELLGELPLAFAAAEGARFDALRLLAESAAAVVELATGRAAEAAVRLADLAASNHLP
jgi:hypothetical protein